MGNQEGIKNNSKYLSYNSDKFFLFKKSYTDFKKKKNKKLRVVEEGLLSRMFFYLLNLKNVKGWNSITTNTIVDRLEFISQKFVKKYGRKEVHGAMSCIFKAAKKEGLIADFKTKDTGRKAGRKVEVEYLYAFKMAL